MTEIAELLREILAELKKQSEQPEKEEWYEQVIRRKLELRSTETGLETRQKVIECRTRMNSAAVQTLELFQKHGLSNYEAREVLQKLLDVMVRQFSRTPVLPEIAVFRIPEP